MGDKAAYFKFFNSHPVSKNTSDSNALTDKFCGKIQLDYLKEAFTFFNTHPVSKNVSDSLALCEKWGTHRLGPIPISFTKTLFKFFNTHPVSKNVTDSLNLIVRFYEMTESDGWLPSYDELIQDVPKFFTFFNTHPVSKNVSDSIALCERVVKGVGRVNLDSFKKAYLEANRNKNVSESLEIAFKAVGL
eukprot:TRINITY_DN55_c0_g1_i1.p1 TRINITY_DN55_c0_g1~~TRINITY_DN55_c0_g1_i1.p1  ORF type:complete len:189 (-),score=40.84 TRINITY_DN55_c0_g1_i1:67-633(-)